MTSPSSRRGTSLQKHVAHSKLTKDKRTVKGVSPHSFCETNLKRNPQLSQQAATILLSFHKQSLMDPVLSHTIAARLRLAGTSCRSLVQPLPAQAGPPTAGCPGPCLPSVSKDGGSTASLGNVCQRSITHTATKCFLMFRGDLPCSRWCPSPLVPSLGTTAHSLAPSSLHLPFAYL